jgi:type II protein arginine methyltransferase
MNGGNSADRRLALLALRAASADRPPALAALARLLLSEGLREEAVEAASRAAALDPRDEAVRAVAAEVLSHGVPAWHFVIVSDAARNEAYESALRRAVTPGCTVLEVGTGTGLLAMMAARAGAGRVVTCEANEAVAHAAREIVARNGFADRIAVIGRHSSTLDLERDLGAPADVFVSEIVSNNMVGEGVLDVLEDVRHRLVRKGGAVIPSGGQVRVALCCDAHWERGRVATVSGFDLRPFNQLAPPRRVAAVNAARVGLRSAASDLFDIDFASGGPFPDRSSRVVLRSTGGRVDAVAQWIALDLDAATRYENHPGPGAESCWGVILHPLGRPLDTQPGDEVSVRGRLERHAVRIWVEDVRG